jgi:hypothetical protein
MDDRWECSLFGVVVGDGDEVVYGVERFCEDGY